ncbi:RHS repeat-associated core domain-containing protein [Myroides profundi]|uniref:RHS repeat-associated core domain-containing protein n=1 Tax=Myroides profundi TaxID=480520 RepID=A0AAJ5BER5_MYRPR|nr:RHS repeat-associated core domain-containing protein [Myroides profundi]AJH15243.1 YD repeat (two copies) [Myroides profundi]SER25079.1 RHS repeat-associated core domain-containing protein [Myroides profundi]
MELVGKLASSPTGERAFGTLFSEAKSKLDQLQSKLASSVFPSMPGQDVAKFYDLAIGIDAHTTIWPPSPLCPVPHVGMVYDIMSAVMAGISSVVPAPTDSDGTLVTIAKTLVKGMAPSVKVHDRWIANAGSSIQHLPAIIAHVPFPLVAPMASSEMFMGSSTVIADGTPCSTRFHPALSCNLIGIPAPFRAKKAVKAKTSLMAPTSMLSIITSSGKPVLVGGPPTIDLFQLGISLGLKGVGKLWKKVGDVFQNFVDFIKKKNPFLGNILQWIKCRSFGEPVDAVTGRVTSTNIDVELSGAIPFVWERTYYSDAHTWGPIGYNFHHSYNMGLYDMGEYFSVRLSDGREIAMPKVSDNDCFYNRTEKMWIYKDDKGYYIQDNAKLRYRFLGPKNREEYQMLSSIESQEGFSIVLEYHGKGNLKRIKDSTERYIEVDTDDRGLITKLYSIYPNETITWIEYTYDDKQQLVYIKDVAGAEKHFKYENDLLVQLTNQTGQNYYWKYQKIEGAYKCVHTYGDGGVLNYRTEYKPGLTITTNGLGYTTHYYYDKRNLIYKIIDEKGGITHQHYNANQELEVVVDPQGISEKYEYDHYGNLIKISDANGDSAQYVFDRKQNLISINTPGKKEIKLEYDDLDRVIKKQVGKDQIQKYYYSDKYLTQIIDQSDNSWNLFYDSHHQLTQLTYPNQTFAQWQYDTRGNVSVERDVKGNLTHYKYDKANNVIKLEEASGNIHEFEYDSSYNIIQAKDDTHAISFDYGSLGVLLSRVQNGRRVNFTYNTELQLKDISNEKREYYRFELDPVGNVVEEQGFDGQIRKYERDLAGRVTKVIYPDKTWSNYTYSDSGNLLREEHSDGSYSGYQYDKDGLLMAAINEHTTLKLTRDKLGRVIKEHQDKYEVCKTYDSKGNLTKLESNLGADVSMGYNEYGWVMQMDSQTWQAKFSYDKQGLEIQRDLSGGVKVETERDNYGRVIRRGVAVNGVMKVSDRYKWNRTNQLQSIVSDLTRHRVDFKYDQWDNLVSGSYTTSNELKTVYKTPDAVGNLYESAKQDDRVYDKGGKLLKDELHYYYYDAKGNLVFKEFKKTEHPRVVDKKEIQDRFKIKLSGSGIGYQYLWSVSGMLQEVISPMGNQVKFYYDPLGRRIAKTSKGETTRWVWDGNVPLHEWKHREMYPLPMVVNKAGKLSKANESTENIITWLYEVNSFVPCGKIVDGESFSIVTDYLGTPTHAYDKEGKEVWHRELDIYGRCIKGNNDFIPFLYQGQYYDKETQLAYNRFRYYDLKMGMYISQDPIGLMGGMVLYGYVGDSNNGIDPLGLYNPYPRKNGKFGPNPNPQPKPIKDKIHGNSHASTKTNYLYAKIDKDGNFLKWGKTDDIVGRYTLDELGGGKLIPLDAGNIVNIKDIERELAEIVPGIDNKENWAGSKKGQTLSPQAQEIYDKSKANGVKHKH